MGTTANANIVSCPKCGSRNRLVPGSSGEPKCGRCGARLRDDIRPFHLTDTNFVNEVERSPIPVLVDFWAAWCGPCRVIAPVIEQLARELNGKIRVAKLDVDKNQISAARYRVQSIPTLIVFKDGREVDRLVGAQSKEAIILRLRPYLG